MDSFFSTSVFAIAMAVILFGLIQLFKKNKSSLNYLVAFSFCSLGFVLFYFWTILTDTIRNFPLLVYSDIWGTFFVAPGIYLSFVTIMSEGRKTLGSYLLHFIIPVSVALSFLVYNIFKYNEIPELISSGVKHFRTVLIIILSVASDLSLLVYGIAALLRAGQFWRQGRVRRIKEFKIFVIFLVLHIFASMALLGNYLLRNETVFIVISVFYGCFVLFYVFACIRMPEYSQGVPPKKESPQLLKPREIEAYSRKLQILMEEEQRFRDPELKLDDLASELRMTANQLSQLINSVFKMNFKTYINGYRLKAVLAVLKSQPERSILDIALDCGFNAKSSFNTLFIKTMGVSPTEYRKRTLLEEKH